MSAQERPALRGVAVGELWRLKGESGQDWEVEAVDERIGSVTGYPLDRTGRRTFQQTMPIQTLLRLYARQASRDDGP